MEKGVLLVNKIVTEICICSGEKRQVSIFFLMLLYFEWVAVGLKGTLQNVEQMQDFFWGPFGHIVSSVFEFINFTCWVQWNVDFFLCFFI